MVLWLATDADDTVRAVKYLIDSARKLILVTGRRLEELLNVFPHSELFEWIVAENGAVLYSPRSRDIRLLAEAVPSTFRQANHLQ